MKNWIIFFILTMCGFVVVCSFDSGSVQVFSKDLVNDPVARMEQEIEDLRKDLKIPGLSVAISGEDSILWSKGFGWADKEHRIATTENNLFHLASLTKPYATVIMLQLVQEGKLDLNSPVSDFGIELDNKQIKIIHLLSHTSSGNPGTVFKYDGRRFGLLEKVIEEVTGNSFALELRNRILEPLLI